MGAWTSPKDKLTPEEQEKQKKILKIVKPIVLGIFAFLGIIIISVAAGGGFSSNTIKEEKPDVSDVQAFNITKDLLKEQIEKEYPEVDFPLLDYKHDYMKFNEYLIISYFDYENKFGGKERFYYKARVKYNGGDKFKPENWTLVYVEEYDKNLY